MREIKFRAWERHLKEMIPVHDINFASEIINVDFAWRTFKEIELMQYTGLQDRNGTEIYEDDIVRGTGLGVVEFDLHHLNCGFVVNRGVIPSQKNQVSMPLGIPAILEVIGNIYENPELLQ